MSYLQLTGITKKFNDNTVLHDIHLNAAKGEMITLLGPSGCGKSTLLRCISGLTEIEAGSIKLDQRELSPLAPRDREVGMVFQSYALFPNLNVSQNIGYGLKMKKIHKEQRAKSVNELLQLVDLSEKSEAYPHELSGGQQQRVALARSLAMQPKLMLLDEPLSALDAKIRKNLRMEIRQLQKRLMMTMIFVTHDQEEALMISDRICVMRNGVIVQEGSPEHIYSAPRTEFVARFIGNYNVLTPDQATLLNGLVRVPGASYAIRPESIILLPGEGAESAWHMANTNEMISVTSTTASTMQSRSGSEAPLYWKGKVVSMIMLGNILRYSVESAGILLSVDVLAGQGTFRPSEQSEVTLCVYSSQCIPLEKDGA